MGYDDILRILRTNAASVLAIDPSTIATARALTEVGANSIDRMEIVTMTMEALNLTFPLVELVGVDTLDGLASVFERRATDGAR